MAIVNPRFSLLLRAYESHGSVQQTQEKEKNRPVILLVSACVNTKRATKNDGYHVYDNRDLKQNVEPRSFAYGKCIRHKEPNLGSIMSLLFVAVREKN
jgi:hypothetical protein